MSTSTTTGAVYSNPKRILGTARDARLRATSSRHCLLTVIVIVIDLNASPLLIGMAGRVA